MEFEIIDENHQRAKVPGGWLVKAFEDVVHFANPQEIATGWDWRMAIAFVPDPNHEWNIKESSNDTK